MTSELTDKDKMRSLLTEFGVRFEEICLDENRDRLMLQIKDDDIRSYGVVPPCKVTGYTGFWTAFEFDGVGAFTQVIIYE